ncbi:toxin Cry1Ac domain D-VI-related protein [Candidatus Enterococcus mansonii]
MGRIKVKYYYFIIIIMVSIAVIFLRNGNKIQADIVDTNAEQKNVKSEKSGISLEGPLVSFTTWSFYNITQTGQDLFYVGRGDKFNTKTSWFETTKNDSEISIIHSHIPGSTTPTSISAFARFNEKSTNYYRVVMDVYPGGINGASIKPKVQIARNGSPEVLTTEYAHVDFIFKGEYENFAGPIVINIAEPSINLTYKYQTLIKNIKLYDLGPVTSDQVNTYVTDLFTDSTHTELKTSVTQAKIDEAKRMVESFTAGATSTALKAEVTKAQNLLNKIRMTLTVSDLVDNPLESNSHTITGKTYPKAFLRFSGTPSIENGQLTTGIDGDSIQYHLRADAAGNFSYSLPEGEFFKAGATINIYGMLNGKSISQNKIVKDTTPPEKPILNAIKDTSQSITGSAEAGTTIKMYDVETNNEFLTGTVGAQGQFNISIPSTKQPLVPYKKYFVTTTDAAGNVSVSSDSQEVADTTPPKADPVQQIIDVGTKLPPMEQLIKNIYDNAGSGSDNLTIKLTKEPDTRQVGYKEAEVTLTDKAGNFTVVKVPIVVKNPETLIDDRYLLQASDLTALAIDLPDTKEKQREFMLERAPINAWDLRTGKLVNDDIIFDYGTFTKQPGSYEITVTIGNLSKKINLTLLEGSIFFQESPRDIYFGEQSIIAKNQEIEAKNAIRLVINDQRFQRERWRLLARTNQPFTTATGIESGMTLAYRTYDTNNHYTDTSINELDTALIYESKNNQDRLIQLDFTKERQQELILKVQPGSVRSNIEYSAKVLWTIENGP